MALIYACESTASSDFKVCEVPSRHLADLLVFVEKSRAQAQGIDGVWCFVDSISAATSKACWVMSRNSADLFVCFVTSRSAAGWRREHPLMCKL